MGLFRRADQNGEGHHLTRASAGIVVWPMLQIRHELHDQNVIIRRHWPGSSSHNQSATGGRPPPPSIPPHPSHRRRSTTSLPLNPAVVIVTSNLISLLRLPPPLRRKTFTVEKVVPLQVAARREKTFRSLCASSVIIIIRNRYSSPPRQLPCRTAPLVYYRLVSLVPEFCYQLRYRHGRCENFIQARAAGAVTPT